MNIIITRHGQTDWNISGKFQGQTNIELNEVGKAQAHETAVSLKNEHIDLIFCSTLNRAIETAEIINEFHNVPIYKDDRLNERYLGIVEGANRDDFVSLKQKFPKLADSLKLIYDGDVADVERKSTFMGRIYDFLDEIIKKYSGKNILVVTHAGVTVPIQAYFEKDNSLDLSNAKRLGNCEVIKYEVWNIKKDGSFNF